MAEVTLLESLMMTVSQEKLMVAPTAALRKKPEAPAYEGESGDADGGMAPVTVMNCDDDDDDDV